MTALVPQNALCWTNCFTFLAGCSTGLCRIQQGDSTSAAAVSLTGHNGWPRSIWMQQQHDVYITHPNGCYQSLLHHGDQE